MDKTATKNRLVAVVRALAPAELLTMPWKRM